MGLDFGAREIWAQILAQAMTGCVTFSQVLNQSDLQYRPLWDRNNKTHLTSREDRWKHL